MFRVFTLPMILRQPTNLLHISNINWVPCARELYGTHEGKNSSYIFVIDELHELELAVGPLGVRHILEGARQLLYGHVLLSYRVVRRAEIYITLSFTIHYSVTMFI